ncbi:MAG: type II toxin-antitoxin system VapC family toxin [Rubrobacteraceae bacterium]
MNGEFLLDTNIVIALTVRDSTVMERLEADVTVFLPSIVIGELFFGAYRSGRVEENLEQVADLAANNIVLACDGATARHYGRIKNQLRDAGRPIPENDIWICALALQHGLSVANRDAHFHEVEGIRLETWQQT